MYVPEEVWYLKGKPYLEQLIKHHFEEMLLMHSYIYPFSTQSVDVDFVDGNVVYTIESTTQEHCDRLLPFVSNNMILSSDIFFKVSSIRLSATTIQITIVRN